MIDPVTFIKVLETMAPLGDRATRLTLAWRVSVVKGDAEFYPIKRFSCFEDGNFFDKEKAIEWSKEVSEILGTIPIMAFKKVNGLDDQFVEDIE